MIVDFLYSINLGLLILFFFWVIILIFILLRKPNKIRLIAKLFIISFLILLFLFSLVSYFIRSDSFF